MKNERDKNGITELLYEHDGMLTEFDATVVECGRCAKCQKDYVVLDRTAFFPEGGGQDADTGELICDDKSTVSVTDVQTVDGQVRHYVDRCLQEGISIHGKIDKDIRYARMQNHGAEHLVCGLIHNLYGFDNVGFHMTGEGMVIDISGPLTKEQLADIEMRANKVVYENVPVTVSFPSALEAKKTDYRSKLDIEDNIRLVTIEGYDVCACCAPHLDSTGRFGVIKILGSAPHRGGTRITMIAGTDAYKDYVMLHNDNAKIMELLSSGRDHTADFVSDLLERYAALKEDMGQLRKKMAGIETGEALKRLKDRGSSDTVPELIFSESTDPVGLRNLVNECTKVFEGIVCAFLSEESGYRYIFSVCEKNVSEAGLQSLAKDFNEKCSGRGGGSNIMVQGSTKADRDHIEAYFAQKYQKP